MNNTKNAKGFALILTLVTLSCPWVASADPIYAEYEIGYYAESGYSASWIHGSTGCIQNGSYGPLYMCGGPLIPLTGEISGWLNEGILSGISGYLTNGDLVINIIAGFLTPFSGGDSSHFLMEYGGDLHVATFEPFSMGSGLPNYFDGDEFILWGQNYWAYACSPSQASSGNCDGERFGLDLYGKRVSVPEPSSLALLGLGLIGLGFARRRKTA